MTKQRFGRSATRRKWRFCRIRKCCHPCSDQGKCRARWQMLRMRTKCHPGWQWHLVRLTAITHARKAVKREVRSICHPPPEGDVR